MTATLSLLGWVLMATGETRLSAESVHSLVQRVDKAYNLKMTAHDRTAMVTISRLESEHRPKIKNKRSSAYGLFQFLDSTWKGTGIAKTDIPFFQTLAAYRYMKRRYGSPVKALRHKYKTGVY